jgi:hypothetical protein
VDANAREAVVIVAETDERAKENAEGDDGANGGSGGGPVPRVFPLRPSDLASNAYRVTESRAAMLLPKRSAAPVPAPSAQKKHKARNLANDAKKTGGHDGLTAVMTPLPISKSVLDRIDALGPEMQPAQKYILLLGIALDFYAKTQLIRELRRFALMGDNGGWGWFAAVFLFFLLSGSATTAYWLLHYPMPTPREIEELSGKNATRVFGFTKLDFKKMVRTAGAVASMCQLGTAFAAWRALRVKDLRQRKAEMDLRGMQLVDTVFSVTPGGDPAGVRRHEVLVPRARVSRPIGVRHFVVPRRLGAITSATLCFVSLDLHEKPPSLTWRQYWRAHKAHLSETVAKSAFRFLELSARVSLIALFSAVKGGWVFFVFFMHAVLVLIALRFWPRVVGGGVPDRGVWKKLVAVERVIVSPKRKVVARAALQRARRVPPHPGRLQAPGGDHDLAALHVRGERHGQEGALLVAQQNLPAQILPLRGPKRRHLPAAPVRRFAGIRGVPDVPHRRVRHREQAALPHLLPVRRARQPRVAHGRRRLDLRGGAVEPVPPRGAAARRQKSAQSGRARDGGRGGRVRLRRRRRRVRVRVEGVARAGRGGGRRRRRRRRI